MENKALKIAYDYLDNDNLNIMSYAETDKYFIFCYTYKNKPVFDNCMVQVDKKTGHASDYIITEHFNELNNLIFKELN